MEVLSELRCKDGRGKERRMKEALRAFLEAFYLAYNNDDRAIIGAELCGFIECILSTEEERKEECG